MNTESTAKPLLSKQVSEYLYTAMHDLVNWAEHVTPEYARLLNTEEVSIEIVRQNYIDGYWRIQQTTPLILAILKRLNEQQNMSSIRFWNDHLSEELGHDLIMRNDLTEIYGSEVETSKILEKQSITAPSVAIIGYYQWQVEHNNPHMLIILRFFLESYFDNINDSEETLMKKSLGSNSVQTLSLHKVADKEHVQACFDYVDKNFKKEDMPELIWSINLIATCLLESQVMIANRVCKNYC